MMTNEECKKTIDWLREFIFRLEDRSDHEAFQEHINRLKASANELQERLSALETANDAKILEEKRHAFKTSPE